MAEIIPFKKPAPEEPDVPHGAGTAKCIDCKHEWQAVVPIGTEWFECPQCLTHKGRWKFSFYPNVGDTIRVCKCGNDLFHLTPEGHLCANCGVYQRY